MSEQNNQQSVINQKQVAPKSNSNCGCKVDCTNNKQNTASNPAFHVMKHQQQALTEQRTKEIVLETLIELNLVPNAQKKKVITA
jgi:hypothetical protein